MLQVPPVGVIRSRLPLWTVMFWPSDNVTSTSLGTLLSQVTVVNYFSVHLCKITYRLNLCPVPHRTETPTVLYDRNQLTIDHFHDGFGTLIFFSAYLPVNSRQREVFWMLEYVSRLHHNLDPRWLTYFLDWGPPSWDFMVSFTCTTLRESKREQVSKFGGSKPYLPMWRYQ